MPNLKKAQDVSARPRESAGNLHDEKINNPAVHPATQHRQTVLHVPHQPVVEVVDVKPIGKERNEDRIFRRVAIKQQREAGSQNEHRQKNVVQDVGNVLGFLEVKKELFDLRVAGRPCGNRQENQRDNHYRGRFVGMLGMIAPRRSKKNHRQEPKHVESGQSCRHHSDPAKDRLFDHRPGDDEIFAEVATESRKPAQGEGSHDKTCESHRSLSFQPAHVPDVLLVVKSDDHRSGAQEEKALEEGVRKEMKHRHVRHRSDARSQDHVAELRNRRVGQDALDVVLLRRHEAGGQAGEGADPGDDVAGDRSRQREEGRRAPACTRLPRPWSPHGAARRPAWDLPWNWEARHEAEAGRTFRLRRRRPGCTRWSGSGPWDSRSGTLAKISPKTTEPVANQSMRMPSMKPKSPMRLTMKACLQASAAEALL